MHVCRPDIIAHVVPNLDAPEIKEAVASNYLQSMGMLFEGAGAPRAALPAAQTTAEVIPDDGADGGYEAGGMPEEPDDAPDFDDPDAIFCDDCGEQIVETRAKDGRIWTPENMYDITPIIEAVAALIAALITAFLVPYIKSKTTAEQQKEINAWVKIAVSAAEQIYTGSGRGEEKKEYVISWLREHGITVDEAKLDALIEAAVYELNTNGIVPVIGIPDAVVTTTIETAEKSD